ncbi:DUF1186 domain-containing protein [Legionella drancourtii]|uniref:DUF1186 domain-containing protein n=1 Tax=Legionella drancourtii LLAP12 TaxID=658187 RepID=G9EME7_9GAMM|nr:DUF1186 domain-containing protein [Legionella drancourtii]EHL31560.1 hypothetical protein LDG_6413 [Legionella drancourtii LLAP12]
MTIEQFIESISTIPYRSLEKEFDFARKNQALVTPHLLNILEKTLESLNKESIKSRSAHVIAIYLLALFREQKAYPLIIELLNKMPNSFEHSLFNDEIEDMPNILASTFNGNIELIYKLIENIKAFEFARIAAIDSLVALWHTKQISRESVIAYFGNLLTNNFNKNKDTKLQPWIIHSALRLYPEEIISSIRLAFYFLGEDLYWSNDTLILPNEFETAMKKGKEYVFKTYLDKDNPHIITCLAEEFKDWCWFAPKPQYQIRAEEMLEPIEVVEEQIILEEKGIKEEDIMFVGDDKHMAYCHKLYGDFNEKGLQSLQEKYDTVHIKHASELASKLQYHASELKESIELMEQASRELIYGESPFCNNYKIDEQGDIGYFASEELCHVASSIEDIIAQISKKLAPLGRLFPTESDDDDVFFHKEVDDWLDDPKGYRHGSPSYFD